MASRFRHIVRRTAVFAIVATTGAGLGYAWHASRDVRLTAVEFHGVEHADVEQLHRLLALPDSARIFDLEPHLLADRAEREPWVRRARVTRWLSGKLAVTVEERTPVALVIDEGGRPAAFLDAEGYSMPLTPSAIRVGHDVPLLTGHLPALLPTQPVSDAPLRRLLAELPPPDSFGDALISSIERRRDGALSLTTAPGPGGAAITVELGRDGFSEKFRRLEAFWEQIVLTSSEPTVRRIDLRFDQQIVADELSESPSSAPTRTPHE